MDIISKKVLSIIVVILVLFIISIFFVFKTQAPADEKVKGTWSYHYNDHPHQSFYLKSDKTGMYVGSGGDQVEVFPLKRGNQQNFDFLLEENNDKNYVFHVEIKDKNHLVITPHAENKRSLQEVLFGTNNLSEKSKKDISIELKKDK